RPADNPSTLVIREKHVVINNIAEQCDTRTHECIDHVPCDHLDVRVGATLEFGRNRMRPQEGPNDTDAGRLAAFRRGPEDLQLILGPQTVSALHLHRPRPEGEHRSEALRGPAGKLVLWRLSRRPHAT